MQDWNEALLKVFDQMQTVITFRVRGATSVHNRLFGDRPAPSSLNTRPMTHAKTASICANAGDSFGGLLLLIEYTKLGYTEEKVQFGLHARTQSHTMHLVRLAHTWVQSRVQARGRGIQRNQSRVGWLGWI